MGVMARGCADIGGCDDSVVNGGTGCHLCDVVARLPQPRTAMDRLEQAANVTRDGEAELKGGENLAFKKRHRVGPHR
jgi:hypothetical protein